MGYLSLFLGLHFPSAQFFIFSVGSIPLHPHLPIPSVR